jgi:HSP90 family molecular chaperone
VADELKKPPKSDAITPEDFASLSKWMREVLVDKITTITSTERLSSTPLIIVDHESATFRRMMRTIDPKNTPELPKQQIQVNSSHPIIKQINNIRNVDQELAREALLQLFDNALIQAGLVDDSRTMVPRINKILERALGSLPTPPIRESTASSSGTNE